MLVLALGLAPARAMAHGAGEGSSPVDVWLLLAVGLPILAYSLGVSRLWLSAGPGRGARYVRVAAFVAGWSAAVLALSSPLHAFAERSFFGHMLVHSLLMLTAAPLVVLARPLAPLAWSLPRAFRHRLFRTPLVRAFVGPAHLLAGPLTATLAQTVALTFWHLPALFNLALRERPVHSLQHATFLIASLLFWWAVLEGRRSNDGVAVLCLFLASVHGTLLGALLTIAPTAWYISPATPPFGLSPLEDQQLGGLVMWVPAGFVYVAAGLVLFARWLRASGGRGWTAEAG